MKCSNPQGGPVGPGNLLPGADRRAARDVLLGPREPVSHSLSQRLTKALGLPVLRVDGSTASVGLQSFRPFVSTLLSPQKSQPSASPPPEDSRCRSRDSASLLFLSKTVSDANSPPGRWTGLLGDAPRRTADGGLRSDSGRPGGKGDHLPPSVPLTTGFRGRGASPAWKGHAGPCLTPGRAPQGCPDPGRRTRTSRVSGTHVPPRGRAPQLRRFAMLPPPPTPAAPGALLYIQNHGGWGQCGFSATGGGRLP